jgi:cytoskeletal protein CcmA (bactofilin family)
MSIFTKAGEANTDPPEYLRKEVSPVRSKTNPDTSSEISIVARGVRVDGDVHVEGDVRIGGKISGSLTVDDRVVVAPEGVILGGIKAGEGDVAGKVEGDIVTGGRLIIRKTASVLGQIIAESLVVEEGAKLDGVCKVGKPSRIEKKSDGVGDGAETGTPTFLGLEE